MLGEKAIHDKMARMSKLTITDDHAGQRLDNFLLSHLKGVPKTRIYKAIRKGEVRVNGGRVRAFYRLAIGDELRLPPLRQAAQKTLIPPSEALMIDLELRIIHEDAGLMIIDKPTGIPVHGGTNISAGLIETLRLMRPQCKLLELVHRLDRQTSGCLLIAKKRSVLTELQALFAKRQVKKGYMALLKGQLDKDSTSLDLPLRKNTPISGERMVVVDKREGKPAKTRFQVIKRFADVTLVAAYPLTGRTHQIRVHAKAMGHPLAGDDKYGDKEFNKKMKILGLKRLFLHSMMIECQMAGDRQIGLCVLLADDLEAVIPRLACSA